MPIGAMPQRSTLLAQATLYTNAIQAFRSWLRFQVAGSALLKPGAIVSAGLLMRQRSSGNPGAAVSNSWSLSGASDAALDDLLDLTQAASELPAAPVVDQEGWVE